MGLGQRDAKSRRSYRPTVEALEALRLLSIGTQAFPDLAVGRDVYPGAGPIEVNTVPAPGPAWDLALDQTAVADLFGTGEVATDPKAIASGFSQMNRYLSRSWYRAGIPVQMHDDCSQAVYVSLLNTLGRDSFDSLMERIGNVGIRDVLSRETSDGPDFFRAVDTVKKRAQRERSYLSLDSVTSTATAPEDGTRSDWRGALQEVIDQSLNPREAALIYATLKGETPAEIAQQWGVAPKTVSNEKTRVIQKLREALSDDLAN